MAASLGRGDALTCVQAPSAKSGLWMSLRWMGTWDSPPAFVSNGPIVENWGDMLRVWVYGAEDFVNEASLYPSELHVRSDVGLKEVALYDGERLFRRFLPGGAKELEKKLFFSGEERRTISVVATDLNGGQAVNAPRSCLKDGQMTAAFCGDHVNDCTQGNKLAHGVHWPPFFLSAIIPDAGNVWDGGPWPLINLLDLTAIHYFNCQFSDGSQEGGMPYQYPVLSLSDGRVYRATTVAAGTVKTDVGFPGPWTSWGPVAPRQLYDASATLTVWSQYSTGVDPNGWGTPYLSGGSMDSLFEEAFVFKRNGVVKVLSIGGGNSAPAVKNRGTLLSGVGENILDTFDLTPGARRTSTVMKVPVGGWFGVVSSNGANAILTFNRGAAMRLSASEQTHFLAVDVPAEGLPVKKGQETEGRIAHHPLAAERSH